ncbi:MAG: ATP-grasp domain-containing protein [Candidatus Baldrarchaeia archaeon]
MVKKLLIVGFNARPVAKSAKLSGYSTIVIDYWGDVDLIPVADHFLAVTRCFDENRISETPTKELFLELAERAVKMWGPVDAILICSGFDDFPEIWKQLSELAPICGNDPKILEKARNVKNLFDEARKAGAYFPKTYYAAEPDDVLKIREKIDFPFVIKPKTGGGGIGIRLIRSEKDLDRVFSIWKEKYPNGAYVQEYVRGLDVSTSVMCTGHSAITISVNEQLIGVKYACPPTRFTYCGNIVPLDAHSEILEHLMEISSTLAERLHLVGSNGFDWVLDMEGCPFIMECNPRFQGTLEPIEMATGASIVKMHIRACEGELPEGPLQFKRYACKVILFSERDIHVPDLSNIRNIFDIPHPNSAIRRGQPICTIIETGYSRKIALRKCLMKIAAIRRLLRARNEKFRSQKPS